MKTTILATLVLAGLLTGPVHAQGNPGPSEMPPGEPPSGPPGPQSPAERQRNNAAKLAGLVAFVRIHCADLRPDDERFRAVVSGLGVPLDDLEAGDLHLRAMTYAEVYAKDIQASCTRATESFGENGRTLPGLIAKR